MNFNINTSRCFSKTPSNKPQTFHVQPVVPTLSSTYDDSGWVLADASSWPDAVQGSLTTDVSLAVVVTQKMSQLPLLNALVDFVNGCTSVKDLWMTTRSLSDCQEAEKAHNINNIHYLHLMKCSRQAKEEMFLSCLPKVFKRFSRNLVEL